MYIEEDVGRRESTIQVDNWKDAYYEFKDILEKRFQFMRVEEVEFEHHKDHGTVFSIINAHRHLDDFTRILLDLRFNIKIGSDSENAEILLDSKALVITEYPEETSFQESLLYYAFRSMWDKLVYGWNRRRWKEQADELLVRVHEQLRAIGSVTSRGV